MTQRQPADEMEPTEQTEQTVETPAHGAPEMTTDAATTSQFGAPLTTRGGR